MLQGVVPSCLLTIPAGFHVAPAAAVIAALIEKKPSAVVGGYKQSGVGRETHKMMLDHYQQTKNMLVSYSPKKLGFF